MKKIFIKSVLLIFVMILSNISKITAQPGIGISFKFSTAVGVPVFPAAGTVNIGPLPLPSQNDTAILVAPAGMNVKFSGRTYTQFIVSTNGWLALTNGGPIPPALIAGGYLNTNQLSTYFGGLPFFAPYWDDLATSIFSYNYAANVLWVRWTAKIDKTAGVAANIFYVRIDGTTGVINYYYANNAAYALGGPPSASIGLAGACTGDYYSYNLNIAPAFADSTIETSNISTKPNNITYTFTPYQWFDNCANAKDLGTVGASCSAATFNINNAVTSGSAICSTTDVADVWFKITKPPGISNVLVTTSPAAGCQLVSGTSVEVFTSPCGGISLGCATTGSSAGYGEITLSRGPCVSETLYIRVTADGDVGGKFNICVKDAGAVGVVGTTCSSPNWICAPLPFNYTGTTAGFGNEYDSTSSVCHSSFMNGEDYVFAYTPTTSGCIKVDLTGAGINPAVFVSSGCPSSPGSYCLDERDNVGTINAVSLVAGQTYYIVVDNNITSGNTNNPFSITVSNSGFGVPPNDLCSIAKDLGLVGAGVTCVKQTSSTACSTPTLPTSQAGSPTGCTGSGSIPGFVDGVTGDVWLKFNATFTGALQINTYTAAVNTTTDAAMAVYTGTCGSMGPPIACNTGGSFMPSLSISVISGTIYYIRVWSEHPQNEGDFDICFVSSCGPPNDLPCNAVMVPVGGFASGTNVCATDNNLLEPGNAAQCVGGPGQTINTVWYSAIIPVSGSLIARTHPNGITDTEIGGYYFRNGCLNARTLNSFAAPFPGCNHLGGACAGGIASFSEQLYTGNAGDTVYVAVDGVGTLTGTFDITFIDGATTVYPPLPKQDCPAAQAVCNSSDIVIADPGFSGSGNICDLTSGPGCFGVTERNSSWYQFTIDTLSGNIGTISFDILSSINTDIDFVMWDITGLPNGCQSIHDITIPTVACNYAGAQGSTGLSLTGTGISPDPYSPSVLFSGGPHTYMLLVNSWIPNGPTNAFTLKWGSGFSFATPTVVNWEGATDTSFATITNWGDCGPVPTCAIDANINPTANLRQPTVLAGVQNVHNITISLGATLTVVGTLNVCGNFINGGNLVCMPGSIIQFIGTGPQTISGFLTGANKFANLVITKGSGSVQLLSDIDVFQNFTTTNPTSIFDINGKYMKVGGNFSNNNANITFTGIGGSTVEFDTTSMQNFTNTTGSILLNRVVMNKPSGRVNLTGLNSTMNIDSTLTLTSGIITTRSIPALEVNMKYNLPAAVTGQNALSYIDGKLRRKISIGPAVSGSYEFPVGDILSPGGYERAVINFTTTTTIPDLLATFTNWTAVPNGPTSPPECIIATYNLLPFLNNGYWTFNKSSAIFTGNYNITLHNRGYTNSGGSNGWTVAKADLASLPNAAASWGLLGVCATGSTADSTKRDQINLVPSSPTSFNHFYASAQTVLKLPIELLYFSAEPKGEEVLCKWETASEINNEYFDVERSNDGKEFTAIERVKGFGNGTSTETRKYSFVDHNLCENIRYYRLKQVDINGDYSYSNTVAINCRKSSGIELFPNPANTIIKYQFYYSENTELTVYILDISGRIVRTEKIIVQKGINQITSRIEDLAAGVYNLRISGVESGNGMLQKQFFKN